MNLALAAAHPIMAAEPAASGSDDGTMETVVITGFRGSIEKARDFKRKSDIVSEEIVAEDMAKFPDLNLAESLQRLPGVTITREAGEGRRVSLRGLDTNFTRVDLNGMEALGNVDSPMDSRGQLSRDRTFDFNIFASELFSRVAVSKSFSAEQNEGGMAGTVGLFTAKPFDYDEGMKGSVAFKGGTNTLTYDLQPRMAGMFSWNYQDKFGVLVSIAYSQRQTEEQGTNTYRFRKVTDSATDVSALSDELQEAFADKELAFPRGNRLSVWDSKQRRLGITTAVQWRPVQNLTLTLDALYGEFGNHRQEHNLATRASDGSTIIGGEVTGGGVDYPAPTVNDIEVDAYNDVIYEDVDNTVFASESRRQVAKNVFKQIVFSADWQVNERLRINGHIGTENSSYNMPISDKFYLQAIGGAIFDYTKDTFHLSTTYKWDTVDPDNYHAQQINFEAAYQKTNFDSGDLNAEYQLTDVFALKVGGAYRKFENSGYQQLNDNVNKSDWADGTLDASVDSYYKVFKNHKDQNWIAVDWNSALSYYGITRTVGDKSSDYTVSEATYAGYMQLDWQSHLMGLPFHGNLGVRGYETDVTSSGETDEGYATVDHDYFDFLPALNATLDLNEKTLLRFAYSRNINRPSLSSMSIAGDVDQDTSTGDITVDVGNPDLKPYMADNIDLSLEYYFGKTGMLAASGYFKHISGFIGSETVSNVKYSETGLPTDLLEGITENTIVSSYTRPVNYEDTDLYGLELTAQSDFTFLPAPFDKLGGIANMTFVHSTLDYATPEEQAAGEHKVLGLEGMSSVSGNFTLYYDTPEWGMRGSANYRSGYISDGSDTTEADRAGFNSTIYVDASAYYQVTDKLRMTFDAINLLDTREEQFTGKHHLLYNATTSGVTYMVGLQMEF